MRRLEACKLLGWKTMPVNRIPLKDLVKGEFHENAVRKDFTISEMVAIKRAIEPEIKEEAKARILSGKPCEESAQGKTRDLVSKFVGVSHDTLRKAEELVDCAEADPETFKPILDKVDTGETSLNYAYQMVIQRRKEESDAS